jgi:hypothetical protein
MPEIHVTESQKERLAALQDELADEVVGKYGTVRPQDAVEYLLDRYADDAEGADASGGTTGESGLPSGDGTDGDGLDDAVAKLGSSGGTTTVRRTGEDDSATEADDADPAVDVDDETDDPPDDNGTDSEASDGDGDADSDDAGEDENDEAENGEAGANGDDAGDGDDGDEVDEEDSSDADDDGGTTPDGDDGDEGDADETDEDAGADDSGSGATLNAMMNLLSAHDDKWREAGGDARYEVDLPDGSVESARTKDDVRALLFKHYR